MQEFETELDELNAYYRGKVVTIIPVPMAIGQVPPNPEHIAQFCTGVWIKAMTSGIWIQTFGRGSTTRDFFYHNQAVKIEEAVDMGKDIPKDVADMLNDEFQAQDRAKIVESRGQREIIASRAEAVGDDAPPDVLDPKDTESINNALAEARDMVRVNRKRESDFLDDGRGSQKLDDKLDDTEVEGVVNEDDDSAEK